MFNMLVVIVTCESYLLIQNGAVYSAAQLPKSEEDLTWPIFFVTYFETVISCTSSCRDSSWK